MSYLDTLVAENRQLIRNPYKLVALLIFMLTCFYGLWKGYAFYEGRNTEIQKIKIQQQELIKQASSWLDEGMTGPEDRPWVNIQQPFWAMWYANHYVYDDPSSMMIYSIGQADQFAFQKRVSMWTTGYDPDIIADLHNPEFVGIGSLDFTFVWIFLMPILLIVLLYDVKGLEYDLGFLTSISLQSPSQNGWVLGRASYYFLLVLGLLFLTMIVPFFMLDMSSALMFTYIIYGITYMLFWFVIYFFVIKSGKGQTDQAVKMLVIWLLLAVVIPGGVHQFLNLKYPPNYMMDWLTTKRVEQDKIFSMSYDEILPIVRDQYDWLNSEDYSNEDSVSQSVKNTLYRMVLTIEFDNVVNGILKDLEEKNQAIRKTHLISPVLFFQNRLNSVCGTDYYTNRDFRRSIQKMGSKINERMLQDEVGNVAIDNSVFREYQSIGF